MYWQPPWQTLMEDLWADKVNWENVEAAAVDSEHRRPLVWK